MSTPMGVGYGPPLPIVSFQWWSDGWAYFRQKPGLWMLVTLISGLIASAVYALTFIPAVSSRANPPLSSTGFDILAIFYGGTFEQFAIRTAEAVVLSAVQFVAMGCMCRLALRQIRGESIRASEFFSIGDVLPQIVGAAILSAVILSPASDLLCVPNLIATGLLMFAPVAVVDRGLSPVQALRFSFDLLKKQWLMATVYMFVAGLAAGIGICGLGIGLLVTIPVYVISIAVGYVKFVGLDRFPPQASPYGPTEPGTWPPAPSLSHPRSPQPEEDGEPTNS